MHFKSISIANLFGLYSYNIDFNDIGNNITLITGPNGYGKTTILQILSCLSPAKLYYFYVLKFDEITIELSDNSRYVIKQSVFSNEKTSDDVKKPTTKRVRFEWIGANGLDNAFFEYNPQNIAKASREIRYQMRFEERFIMRDMEADMNAFLMDNRSFNEIIAHALGQDSFILQLEVLQVIFIHSNRIFNEANEENKHLPVEKIQKDLQTELSKVQRRYYELSQRVDGNFIQQVVSNRTNDTSKVDYERLAGEVESKMQVLSKYQLVDKIQIPPYKQNNDSILYAYVKGLQDKYDNFEGIDGKLELFNSLLSTKRFANKSISYSPQHGFQVTSVLGDDIDIKLLSSGEQNEIIMLYKLIFKVPDHSLFLIDEPENSLHVVWQQMFIDDIVRVAQEKKLQVVIATHSISIAAKGQDYSMDLFYLQRDAEDK